MAKEKVTPSEFKTQVLIKLEMLRGCCQVSSIKKSQIAQSIKDFSKVVEDVRFDYGELESKVFASMSGEQK